MPNTHAICASCATAADAHAVAAATIITTTGTIIGTGVRARVQD